MRMSYAFKRACLVVMILTLLLSTSLFALTIQLFTTDGKLKNNHLELLRSLKPGDTIQFANNSKFSYRGFLGEGTNHRILAVTTADAPATIKALRLPLTPNRAMGVFDHYLHGYNSLINTEVRIPKMVDKLKNQYLLMEYIPHQFNGYDFMVNPSKAVGRGVTAEQAEKLLSKAESSFYRFAMELAGHQEIGDFHLGQAVYNVKADKWYLLDFASHSEPVTSFKPKQLNPLTGIEHSLGYSYDDMGRAKINGYNGSFKTRDLTPREERIIKNSEMVIELRRKRLHQECGGNVMMHFMKFADP
jgi:hypothetical protein